MLQRFQIWITTSVDLFTWSKRNASKTKVRDWPIEIGDWPLKILDKTGQLELLRTKMPLQLQPKLHSPLLVRKEQPHLLPHTMNIFKKSTTL